MTMTTMTPANITQTQVEDNTSFSLNDQIHDLQINSPTTTSSRSVDYPFITDDARFSSIDSSISDYPSIMADACFSSVDSSIPDHLVKGPLPKRHTTTQSKSSKKSQVIKKRHGSMDPATFKFIIKHHKECVSEAKEIQSHDLVTIERKNKWNSFWNQATKKARKKKRKKVKFVWEKKKEAVDDAKADFLERIHDLKTPMPSYVYEGPV